MNYCHRLVLPSSQPLPEGAAPIIEGVPAALREDASPGTMSHLLDSLAEAVQQSPRLATVLLHHGLGNLVGIAANLATSQSSAEGEAAGAADSDGVAAVGQAAAGAETQGTAAREAADPAGSAGAAEGAAAGSAGSQDTTAAGAAAGIDVNSCWPAPASSSCSESAAVDAADPAGAHDAAAGAAAARHIEWREMFGFECRLACLALERSLREALQAALQQHGAGLQASSIGGDEGSSDRGSSSAACGAGRSSSGGASGGGGEHSRSGELRTALAAVKQAADSIQLLEEGGRGHSSRAGGRFWGAAGRGSAGAAGVAAGAAA